MQPHILLEDPYIHKARCRKQKCNLVLLALLSLQLISIQGQSM